MRPGDCWAFSRLEHVRIVFGVVFELQEIVAVVDGHGEARERGEADEAGDFDAGVMGDAAEVEGKVVGWREKEVSELKGCVIEIVDFFDFTGDAGEGDVGVLVELAGRAGEGD